MLARAIGALRGGRYGTAMEARGTAPGRQGGTRRAWLWALAVSVGLHVVVLSALLATRLPTVRLPTGAAPAEAKRTLFKVGVQSRPKEVAGAPLPAAGEATKPGGARTKEASPEPAPPVPALEEASPDTAPGGQAPPPAESGEGVADGPTAESSPGGQGVPSGEGASGPAGAGPEAAPRAAAAEATGAGGLEVAAQVHARLAAAAERCYPASARRYQQRGTVEVRFCVDGQGAARDAQVQRTSGAGLLDAAVGDCVLPAAAPFPEVARGQCFTVPVRFGLR